MKNTFLSILILLLAACSDPPAPTLTPTRQLSGPTIAPTEPLFDGPPSEVPPNQGASSGVNDPTAAAQPNEGAMPPLVLNTPAGDHQIIEITALDSTLLRGELYQAPSQTRQPGIVLLDGPNAEWGDFPLQLMQAGFTVLKLQARDESDAQVMLATLESGIADPARLAIIAAAEEARIAFAACALTPSCDAAVLLSPLDEAAINHALPFDRRALLLIASREVTSYSVAQTIHDSVAGEVLLQPLENAGVGTAILGTRPDIATLVVDWLRQRWP